MKVNAERVKVSAMAAFASMMDWKETQLVNVHPEIVTCPVCRLSEMSVEEEDEGAQSRKVHPDIANVIV